MNPGALKYYAVILLLVMIIGSVILYNNIPDVKYPRAASTAEVPWYAPDIDLLPSGAASEQIKYGKELIVHTSRYFGPGGSIAKITNGMECQNCHLDAGTRPYGNSFGAVASTYPKFRERSGRMETIEYRINDCMERSLNGKSIDSLGREMKAMTAYIKWLGKSVPKGVKPPGTGIADITFLDHAADPAKGKIIYINKCQRCHGSNGEGQAKPGGSGFIYPPLWGPDSYNVSAGLYRLSRLAGFVKHNMPFTAIQTDPQLTNEEAWDVAAFVSSQERPVKFFSYDWKNISAKPVDYPFGPYADSFTAGQHKYGPFTVMKKSKK